MTSTPICPRCKQRVSPGEKHSRHECIRVLLGMVEEHLLAYNSVEIALQRTHALQLLDRYREGLRDGITQARGDAAFWDAKVLQRFLDTAEKSGQTNGFKRGWESARSKIVRMIQMQTVDHPATRAALLRRVRTVEPKTPDD